ncbi:MAG TPA: DUF421 domain-containing protein [Clostridiaceae bacterium]|nr:DUF421 domain-containing protein [Clostridiaceae bacterium]
MLVAFVRTLILYILVVLVMRLMGKRQAGELQPFEFVAAIMISELAAIPMQNTGIPLINGIIPILTLLFAQIALSLICLKSNIVRGLIYGKPVILIENGRIQEKNLRKEMYTLIDLIEQLRMKNMHNIADVEFAILETTGQISIIPKSQKRPVTPEDLNIPTKYEGMSLTIILDGEVILKNLEKAGLTEDWLQNELKSKGIGSTKDVLYASLDTEGNLFCQEKMSGGSSRHANN